MTRVGVIGLGGIGERHAQNAGAVATADPVAAAATHRDGFELIASGEVDAVIVASPDATHPDYTIACIDRGLPVLCEKPLAETVADARRVVEAELAAGRRLVQMGFMRAFDPQHEAMVGIPIGRRLLMRAASRNRPWGERRAPADVIVQSAIHDIDSARWLLAAEPASAYAQVIEGVVLLQLTMADGALAVIELHAEAPAYEVVVELVGTNGIAATPEVACAAHPSGHDWLERFAVAYERRVAAWLAGADGPSAWDGYRAQVVADTAIASLTSGLPERVVQQERPPLYGPRHAC